MSHQHHVVECGIASLRIEIMNSLDERDTQIPRRQQDRVARVVGEEPELGAATQYGATLPFSISPSGQSRAVPWTARPGSAPAGRGTT